ncbi:MAG: translocation/assembly module TamB domain-containing protein, partial [Armatimonadetes bacterium]|nr:translocation/assembly module TamB domain-containing protein [Armatimonadota bacterium]
LSEDQLYQIIGTEPLGLVAGGGGGSLTDMFSQQFTGLLAAGFRTAIFRPIEEQIKQALGLDQFTVMFGFDQPIDVRIGKYVMEDLLISYRHTVVSETEDEWDLGLSYELPRKFRVSFTTDEESDAQFRIGYSRSF